MITVIFELSGQDFNRQVYSVPMVGETVFLYEVNGPLKVHKVIHSIRDPGDLDRNIGDHNHSIRIQLGA